MQPTHLRRRSTRILTFFAGMIARFIWFELVLRRLGMGARVARTRSARLTREAIRFRVLAVQLGGVMIKIGQFLSSRLDVLPREITDELAGLQDEVPAVPFAAIRELAEAELGGPLATLFAHVEPEPLAAASLGQVHRARLAHDDAPFTDVVLKVQRPGIAAVVETDLAALARVGRWLMRYRPIRTHADVPALLREFGATLREEIDYRLEADHALTFAANLADHPGVRVPRVVLDRSSRRVLTLEDVSAIKLSDYDAIEAAGIARSAVAERLLEVYLKQIFDHGFVHADPHPGNLFVQPGPDGGADGWLLTFVDFGMVARVPDRTQDQLRELLIAIGTRDAGRVVRAYQALGMLLPGADVEAIEQAGAAVFDRYWGLSMTELREIDPQDVREFAHRYRDLVLDLPFQVPQDLLYVVRTVAILSGMCTGLDPHFNVWEQVAPYARRLVAESVTGGAGGGAGAWVDRLLDALLAGVALPGQVSRTLAQVESRGLAVRDEAAGRALRGMARSVDRLSAAVVTTGLLVAGAVLLSGRFVGLGVGVLVAAGVGLVVVLAGGARR